MIPDILYFVKRQSGVESQGCCKGVIAKEQSDCLS
jgi:hypothetical protein